MDAKDMYRILLVTIVTVLTLDISEVTGRSRSGWQNDQSGPDSNNNYRAENNNGRKVYRRPATKPNKNTRRSERANIVFVLTDDQDYDLGSMNFMPKTLRYLRDEGAHFPNAYVTTPMCCPSRSSMLTGMYAHNHFTFTNNENCSNVQWQQTFEINNFGRYLSDAGYRTGYFGKYLNDYQGTYIPPGWTEWVGLVRNTRFYNYSLNFNGERIKHGDDYHKDYLTDLIANDSVTFLKQSKQYFPNRPVAMVLSMPAPHGPEDSAPQYQHLFDNVTSYRTPSWNYAPNPDKQWLLQNTGKMEPIHMAFTDMLQQKRLQTLQSVDDAVEKVYKELERLGELDNTYFVYSSDHGYHLGQYGLIKGKAMPYEFDIHVPFYIRGPNIPPGSRVSNIALNVDLAPTFLDIAGIETPEHMDGRSLLKLFEDPEVGPNGVLKRKKAWRDTFLVERGKVTNKKIKERERLEADKNQHHLSTKETRLQDECEKAEYQPPCSAKQQWECRRRPDGMLRMYKCRSPYKLPGTKQAAARRLNDVLASGDMCVCPELKSGVIEPSRREKKQQKQFLYDHVNQPDMLKPKFIKARYKRTAAEEYVDRMSGREPIPDMNNIDGPPVVCKVVNNTVICEPEVYTDQSRWSEQKEALHNNIQQLKKQLDSLRNIKKHLKHKKPITVEELYNADDDEDNISLESQEEGSTNLNNNNPPDNSRDSPFAMPSNQNSDEDEKLPMFSSNKTSPVTVEASEHTKDSVDKDVERPYGDVDVDSLGLDGLLGGDGIDSETDYDDGIDRDVDDEDMDEEDEYEFNPEDFQDEQDRQDNSEDEEDLAEDGADSDLPRECPCVDVMMGDQRMSSIEMKKMQKMEQKRDRKMYNRQKKRDKMEERERRRVEKQAYRDRSKKQRRNKNKDVLDPTRDCSSGNMKCFEHTNDHWKTAPFWSKNKNKSPFGARKDPMCDRPGLECTRMDNQHWRVEPHWALGPFCFCPNSNNNTYWCLRTINDSHNFIYCEFITGFISYYDFLNDPYQLRNAVRDLDFSTLNELHKRLDKLRSCKGVKCSERTRPDSHEANPEDLGSGIDMETGSGENEAAVNHYLIPILTLPQSSGDDDVIDSGDDIIKSDLDNKQLDFTKLDLNPVPGHGSVTLESDQSGQGSYSDLELDPEKENFLFYSNVHRLDIAFLDREELMEYKKRNIPNNNNSDIISDSEDINNNEIEKKWKRLLKKHRSFYSNFHHGSNRDSSYSSSRQHLQGHIGPRGRKFKRGFKRLKRRSFIV